MERPGFSYAGVKYAYGMLLELEVQLMSVTPPTTRAELLEWFDRLVTRAVPDNHEDYTKNQLCTRVYGEMFSALDKLGVFEGFPDE